MADGLSPYQAALGETIERLALPLRRCFSAIPPVLGRLYEYAGSFEYPVEPDRESPGPVER